MSCPSVLPEIFTGKVVPNPEVRTPQRVPRKLSPDDKMYKKEKVFFLSVILFMYDIVLDIWTSSGF